MFDVGQWQTARPCSAEPANLGLGEVDAMREPDIRGQPARLFQIVHRAAAKSLLAIGRLVPRLGDVGVKPAAMAARQRRRLRHQFPRDGEGRAGREGDLDHRAVTFLMIARDHAFAVGEDRRHDPARRCRVAGRRRAGIRSMEPRLTTMRMPKASSLHRPGCRSLPRSPAETNSDDRAAVVQPDMRSSVSASRVARRCASGVRRDQ